MAIIKVENLNILIRRKKILQDVSLTFEKGKIYGLLGPNGAGKTTLLKVISGVFRPNSGSVSLFGKPLYSHSEHHLTSSIGSIIEYPGFYDNLTLTENLILHMRYLKKKVLPERIEEVLNMVGLIEHQNKLFLETSLGMKQRLGIARAICHHPQLLLLDEPTNGLDPRGIKDVREMLINEVNRNQTTAIVSSHLLNEIELIADELIFMNYGKIIFETSKNENRSNLSLEDLYLNLVSEGEEYEIAYSK